MIKRAQNIEFKSRQAIIMCLSQYTSRGYSIRQHINPIPSPVLMNPNEWITGYLLVFPGSCRLGRGPTAAGPGRWTDSRRRLAPATWRPLSVYRQRDSQIRTMLWRYTDLFCNCSATYVKTWALGSTLWEIWNNSLPKNTNSIYRGFYARRGVFSRLIIYLVLFAIQNTDFKKIRKH